MGQLLSSPAFCAESARSHGVIQSLRLTSPVPIGAPLPQSRSGGPQEEDQAEGSVPLSHTHRVTRCYQLSSVFLCIKSLASWAQEPQNFASLFVLLLWEGSKKTAGLGSALWAGQSQGPVNRPGRGSLSHHPGEQGRRGHGDQSGGKR